MISQLRFYVKELIPAKEARKTSLSGYRNVFKHRELFAQSLLHWESWSCINITVCPSS